MWEGIGVVSFLLISFWYTRIQAVKSAIQALTMNRVGDMMLSIGLFGMFALFGNLDYSTVFSLSPYVNEISITIIGILLFIGAQHPETPFIVIGQISTFFYFAWFLIIVPVLGIIENTLMDLALIKSVEESKN